MLIFSFLGPEVSSDSQLLGNKRVHLYAFNRYLMRAFVSIEISGFNIWAESQYLQYFYYYLILFIGYMSRKNQKEKFVALKFARMVKRYRSLKFCSILKRLVDIKSVVHIMVTSLNNFVMFLSL